MTKSTFKFPDSCTKDECEIFLGPDLNCNDISGQSLIIISPLSAGMLTGLNFIASNSMGDSHRKTRWMLPIARIFSSFSGMNISVNLP
jgi:hypothetical protein